MINKRISMIKLKEILRLKHEARLSVRKIARSLCLSNGAVSIWTVKRPTLRGIDLVGVAQALHHRRTHSRANAYVQNLGSRSVSGD